MHDIFDYLKWRGDLPFAKVGPNPVDFLIFSTLVYVRFDGIVPEVPNSWMTLKEAADIFFTQSNLESKVRVRKDLDLLKAAADTERFGQIGVSFYRNIFVPEEQKQFAAITYYLADGTAVLAFRGTDRTLVGWKEDFNMMFQDSIPAQREALRYLEEFAGQIVQPMRLTGHSKGGNLAIYAAAKADPTLQQRILEIHSHDGPGFLEKMMVDPGYLAINPKIRSYIPQSSIVGILFEQVEPYAVIKSKQIGPMQHDPYSWEVMRNDFLYMEKLSGSVQFVDRKTKTWLESMTAEERNTLVDAVYEILTSGGAVMTEDLIQPKHFGKYVKLMAMDEAKRVMVTERLTELVKMILAIQKRK